MSLVGNLTSNYDHTAETQGAGYRGPRRTSSDVDRTPNIFRSSSRESHQRNHTLPEEKAEASSSSDEEAVERVRYLARQFSRDSAFSASANSNPFNAEPDSALDPNSENFRPRAWVKAMFQLQSSDGDRFLARTAGVAFRNLNAHGFGAATDYQKSVGNVMLEVVGMARRLMGVAQQRVDILRGFDGLIKPGEMLVVLGPPGSGCSTFLKTLAGETHGFNVDKESYINYQGISFEQMHKNFRGEAIYTAEQDVHFPQLTVAETLYVSILVCQRLCH